MGKHTYRAMCVICGRVRLPFGRSICSRCLATLPGAPRFDRDDDDDDDDDDRRLPRPMVTDTTTPVRPANAE